MSRTDESLLEYAVKHCGNGSIDRAARWVHVAGALGLGSTSATALCVRFNVDPNEAVGIECVWCHFEIGCAEHGSESDL
jgi:hypothetical protein